jgi:hypothetical protein
MAYLNSAGSVTQSAIEQWWVGHLYACLLRVKAMQPGASLILSIILDTAVFVQDAERHLAICYVSNSRKEELEAFGKGAIRAS